MIDSFIEYEELNPLYSDGRMYYLIPGKAEAGEAYQVLVTALDKENR